jgi:hypothetical protein
MTSLNQCVSALVFCVLASLLGCSRPPSGANSAPKPAASQATSVTDPTPVVPPANPSDTRTKVLMHNVNLTERPDFHLRVRWLRGEMYPTEKNVVPSFDDPASFIIKIDAGVIASSLSEISGLLNGGLLEGSPLEKVSLSDEGKQLKLTGTLHKGVSLPVEMISDIGASPDGRIKLHVVKLRVLKVPVKGLMQAFHLKLVDVVGANGGPGVEVQNDDLYLNPQQLVPAPALRGKLTDAHLGSKTGDLITVFGDARPEVTEVKEWRNFIRLYGGTLSFGKLTMKHTDLFLIDSSQDEWFDFDLTRYQEQLVNSRIQMTPQAGLHIFMPDIQKIPSTAANRAINLQWMKNRNSLPPAEATQ